VYDYVSVLSENAPIYVAVNVSQASGPRQEAAGEKKVLAPFSV